MRSCGSSEPDAEIQRDDPSLGAIDAGDAAEHADARTDEKDRPENDVAAGVRHVLLYAPGIAPRAEHARADAEAGAEAAETVIDVRERRAARAQARFREQREVSRMLMAVLLPFVAEDNAEGRGRFLRRADVEAERGPHVSVRHGVFRGALCVRRVRRQHEHHDAGNRGTPTKPIHGARPPHGALCSSSRNRTGLSVTGIRARSIGCVTAALVKHRSPGMVRRTTTSMPFAFSAALSMTIS